LPYDLILVLNVLCCFNHLGLEQKLHSFASYIWQVLCGWKLKLYIRSIGPSMFEAEALGLGAMYETGTICVPKPYKVRILNICLWQLQFSIYYLFHAGARLNWLAARSCSLDRYLLVVLSSSWNSYNLVHLEAIRWETRNCFWLGKCKLLNWNLVLLSLN